MTRIGKHPELNLEDLISEASQNAMKDCDAHSFEHNFDAVFVGTMSAEEFTGDSNIGSLIVDQLGLVPLPAFRVETGSSTGAGVFQAAVLAVASGFYNNILIVAGEKMTHLPTSQTTKILAKVLSRHERAHGLTMPALAALVTRRYMHEFGLTIEELAEVAVKSHYNGSLNPNAHFQKQVTLDKVANSPIVAAPLRVYDCSPMSDGAVAIGISSKKTDINVSGIGQGTDFLSLQDRASLTSFNATKTAAKRAYLMAKKSPKAIEIAEVHDAFTTFEIIDTEDLGFFPKGEGIQAVLEGRTKLEGALPINPSGGHKSRGHPVGASGLAQVAEIAWQLRGECGKRQVDNVKIGLTQSIGGFATNNFVNILEAV